MPPIGTIVFGLAIVIDGDTLALEGVQIGLYGIEAPELSQPCERDGVPYACGIEAKNFLATLVADRQVICTVRVDDNARALAHCTTGGGDIAEAMVRNGWAFAVARQGRQYLVEEERARAERRGVWAGTAEPPWSWRERQR